MSSTLYSVKTPSSEHRSTYLMKQNVNEEFESIEYVDSSLKKFSIAIARLFLSLA
jgi:hypothetical protein